MKNLFPPLPEQIRRELNLVPDIVNKVFPVPARFRSALKHDVAELSRLLTSGRDERNASYLGRPAMLSAYLNYFLPWNIYRLCRLFGSLPLDLKPGDAVNDLGAGPLTLTSALWISRPDLRAVPLEFRCIDRTPAVMDAGRKFFAALSAGSALWQIKTIRGEVRQNGRLSVEIRGKKAALTAAINMYNEIFWNYSPSDTDTLNAIAENQARLLSSLTESSGSVLAVEPGIPRSGQFISLLRDGLIKQGRCVFSPCTHDGLCPFLAAYKKLGKWCHFSFDTEDAPEKLHRLSAAAHLPKERAVLSFIFAGGKRAEMKDEIVRIISDQFPVPARNCSGRYGCSGLGLVLVCGSRGCLTSSPSGALEKVTFDEDEAVDFKSAALIAYKT